MCDLSPRNWAWQVLAFAESLRQTQPEAHLNPSRLVPMLAAVRRPWVTVAILAGVTALLRFLGALDHPVPWIFGDEFIYFETARNLAEHGSFQLRDQAFFISLLTPVLDAPAFLLTTNAEHSYFAIKAINAIVMSSAAFPAYGLARMVLPVRAALGFTALLLAWPAFLSVNFVMTEPAFLPASLSALWLLARALNHPSIARQAAAMGGVLLCVGVRLQAVVLFAAVPLVCGVYAVLGPPLRRGWLRRLRAFVPLIGFSIAAPLLAIAIQVARGAPARALVGGYETNSTGQIEFLTTASWLVRHAAVVGVAICIVPVAIAVATVARFIRRGGDPPSAALFSLAMVIVPVFMVQVAAYASVYSLRVVERNLILVEPLILLVALAGLSSVGYSRSGAIAVAAFLGVTGFLLPAGRLFEPPPFSDTFSLLALDQIAQSLHLAPVTLLRLALVCGFFMTVALVRVPSRQAVEVLVLVMLPFFLWGSVAIGQVINDYSAAVKKANIARPYAWVDRAVGANARVALIWTDSHAPDTVWQQEIWNRSLRTVISANGPMLFDPPQGTFDRATGLYVPVGDEAIPRESLVVAPFDLRLDGLALARMRADGMNMTLWRIRKPLRATLRTDGVASDGWTGKSAAFVAYGCKGGDFRVTLPEGPRPTRRLTVRGSGEPTKHLAVDGSAEQVLAIPALPNVETGNCTLRLTAASTVNTGGRELGVRLGAIDFAPHAANAPSAIVPLPAPRSG